MSINLIINNAPENIGDQLENLRINLQLVHDILSKRNIVYWLDAGTLLKVVRGDSLIPSSDIDYSMWQNDIDEVVLACKDLEKLGFRILAQGGLPYVEDIIQVHFPENSGVPIKHIDFYLYTNFDGNVFRRGIHKPCGHSRWSRLVYLLYRKMIDKHSGNSELLINKLNKLLPDGMRYFLSAILEKIYFYTCSTTWFVFPEMYFESFAEKKYMGIDFFIPNKVESYLEYRYGKSWRKKNKNWRLTDGRYLRFRVLSYYNNCLYKRCYVKFESKIEIKKVFRNQGLFRFTKKEVSYIKDLD